MSNTFETILKKRFDRRSLIGGAVRAIPVASMAAAVRGQAAETGEREAVRDFRLRFSAIAGNTRDAMTVAPGYRSDVLLRWGDPLFSDSPAFDPLNQTAASQAKQFGYNNDWIGYFPLPGYDLTNPSSALLVANHEYTNPELMFQNYLGQTNQTREQTAVEMAAHGLAVVEIRRTRTGRWEYVQGSSYNRRITATTRFQITGPAAGSDLLKTTYDLNGLEVIGTLNNCSGGQTPWGTALSGEENFHSYFSNAGSLPDGPVKAIHTRYGVPSGAGGYPWARHVSRFDVAQEPNEPLRFGWVLEFDPYDPSSTPKKRTALGRFRHEGCTVQVARNGRVVAYMGDDEIFQFAYKFVSSGSYNAFDRAANADLLDRGTLYTAKFNEDGTGEWLPLVYGQGPLTAANGFRSQADVLIDTRRAATLLGATPMDRPEDMEANPINGKVYIALTNNSSRSATQVDKANPRASNRWGQIIEVTEDEADHGATKFTWELFMLCGNGKDANHRAFFAGYDPAAVSMLACPDNITFDSKGNLWIATDGQPAPLGINDGIYAVPTDGPERGFVRQIFSSVPGSETASLIMNSDESALFVSIQHPNEGSRWADNATALTNFPDGKQPARPAVVVVSKSSGSPVIGS